MSSHATGCRAWCSTGPPMVNHVCVWVDDLAGIQAATSHLLRLGHRRIAMVGGPSAPFTTDTRGEGYRQAFTASGLTPPSDMIFRGYLLADVHAAVMSLLGSSTPPTAIVVDNISTASALVAAVHDLGVRVPQDLSVIAYQDIPQADLYRPALTTVAMPLYEAGRRGYAMLQRMIAGQKGQSVVVRRPAPKIINRHSTAQLR